MSENRQIARAAGLVGFLTFLSRVFGLLRDAVVGYYFGTGAAADAFFVAFRAPNLLRRFVAEGAMGTALIPVFTDYLTKRDRREADEAISAVTTLMAIVVALLTVAGIAGAWWITLVFAPGFVDDPGKFDLTVRLTELLFPYIFLVSMVALASGVLNSVRHFAAPAMSPILLNVCMIAAAFVTPFFAQPVEALAWGVIAGGVLQIAVQIPPLRRHGFRLRWRWAPRHEAVRRSLHLMAPMIFGAAVYQINVVVSTILASLLPSGSVSYLWYASRVFEFPLGIFAVALGTAALPSFSAQVSRGQFGEMAGSLSFAVRLTNLITVPASVGIVMLALPITSVLFRRGAYGYEECALTASALAAYAVGLWPVSVVRLVAPAFYALGDTRTPVITAAIAFVVNLICSIALMGSLDAGGSMVGEAVGAITRAFPPSLAMGHVGLSLATSLSAAANMVCLFWVLRRRLPQLRLAPLLPSLVRSLVASLAMIPALLYIRSLVDWEAASFLGRSATLAAAMAAGIAIFGVVALLLGGEEVSAARRILRERLTWLRAQS
jgi:putative peptidoglycan lipid II flippase